MEIKRIQGMNGNAIINNVKDAIIEVSGVNIKIKMNADVQIETEIKNTEDIKLIQERLKNANS